MAQTEKSLQEGLVIVQEDRCRIYIEKLLSVKPYTKKQIFAVLEKHFGTHNTPSPKDDNTVRAFSGKILAEMVGDGRAVLKDGMYTLSQGPAAKTVPTDEKSAKKAFFEALHRGGGSNFESFVAKLLHKYFKDTGKRVLRCEAVGGSADGGIDVHAVTVDALGFYENTMVQTKCRRTQHVTEKEVREFYGAINIQDASRGIYVTTSVFHEAAIKLLDTLPNCVGIDGDKLFELAKQTGVGVSLKNGAYILDLALLEGKK